MQDAGYLQAWGIVGTHSSRKPPRHRNNSIPRPAGRHCPSRRCIDITCPNAPKPDPEDSLWKTPKRDSLERSAPLASPSPQPSTVTGTGESHGGCVNRAHTRPPDLARFHQPLCCLMASERFGCHDISGHRWGGPAGWESCCFGLLEGAGPVTVVAYGVVWVHCTRVGCYWRRVGCTLGRWGLRAVRTTLGQWIPTLVEQADSGRLGAEPASNHDHRDPV